MVSTLVGLVGCLIQSYSCSNFVVAVSAIFWLQICHHRHFPDASPVSMQLGFGKFEPLTGDYVFHLHETFPHSQAWRWFADPSALPLGLGSTAFVSLSSYQISRSMN